MAEQRNDNHLDPNEEKQPAAFNPAGLAIGMAAGLAIGVAMGSIPIGLAIGAGAGIAFSVALGQSQKRE